MGDKAKFYVGKAPNVTLFDAIAKDSAKKPGVAKYDILTKSRILGNYTLK